MDKSLGTNLHLRRLFTRAKQTVRREFIYTGFAPFPQSPHPPYNVAHVYTLFLQMFNIVLGGGTMHFKTDDSVFFKSDLKVH